MKYFIVICYVIAAVYGQQEHTNHAGECPQYSPVENLEDASLLGKWYICAQYAINLPGFDKSISMTLESQGQNNIGVTYSGVTNETGKKITVVGKGVYNGPNNITVQYHLPYMTSMKKQYRILKNEDGYITISTCIQEGSQHTFEIWSTAKDCKSCSMSQSKSQDVLKNLPYKITLTPVDQSNCQ